MQKNRKLGVEFRLIDILANAQTKYGFNMVLPLLSRSLTDLDSRLHEAFQTKHDIFSSLHSKHVHTAKSENNTLGTRCKLNRVFKSRAAVEI